VKKNDRQEIFSFMQEGPRGNAPKPPFDPIELFRLSAQGIYLGTSSWKYRGWEGMIYQGGYSSEAQFQRASLREYTSYFPCVGVDFTYYAWPMAEMMAYLVESTPENFRLCPKVTKRITLSSFPDLPAYGKWAGKKNPDYLNPELFAEQFLTPIRRLQGRLGVVLFEFSGPEENELAKLEAFFRAIPRDLPYAVEIRNPALVKPEFYALLKSLEVSPAFSLWTKMPSLRTQWQACREGGGAAAGLPLVGIGLLREGRAYDDAVRLFQPYKEIQDPNPAAREELAGLALAAQQEGRKAFLLVNNRLEGSAPHTVGKVAELVSGRSASI
jgi:uncharacterized protein YecE (DUF72 family)